jgi:hypothetical protein
MFDNDVPHETADLRRGVGHLVVTAGELGKSAAPDDELCLIAAQRGDVFVTHNHNHFALLHDAWRRWFIAYDVQPAPAHSGILAIPQPKPRQGYWLPDQAAGEIDTFLRQGLPLINRLYRWMPSRAWVERMLVSATVP